MSHVHTWRAACGRVVAAAGALGFASLAIAQTDTPQLPTGTAAQVTLPLLAGADSSYLVGPGDLLNVTVYRSPDLGGALRVASDGTIVFPGIGSIAVSQMTAAQIGAVIAHALKAKGILIDPQVNVLVSEVRAQVVQVVGQVGRPGQIPLDTQGLTLVGVLARAGANFTSGNTIVTVMHKDGSHEQFLIADLTSGGKDRRAVPGEMIVVQAPATVYVSGEVGHPGGFPIEVGMTVGQAIALGGGITTTGSRGRITLSRRQPDGSMRIVHHVDMGMAVMPNDLITVERRVF